MEGGRNMKDINKLRALTEEEINVTDFTEESAAKFREQLLAKSERNPNEPLVIYIDSYGGYVDALAKMIETMEEVPNPLITCVIGKAMSCGAILLAHGDIRYVGRHSRVMIHEVSAGTHGDVHEMKNDVAETERLNQYWLGQLAKKCKIEGGYTSLRKMIKERDGRDIYLSAEDAVKFGVADIVGTPTVKTYTSFEISDTPIKKTTVSIEKPEETKKTTKKTKTVSKKSRKKGVKTNGRK